MTPEEKEKAIDVMFLDPKKLSVRKGIRTRPYMIETSRGRARIALTGEAGERKWVVDMYYGLVNSSVPGTPAYYVLPVRGGH